MDSKYSRSLEKVVIDILQYSGTDINDVFQLIFETILKAEQSEFLEYLDPEDTNKRNGYRLKLIQGLSDSFHINIPRDRQGNFKPFFL